MNVAPDQVLVVALALFVGGLLLRYRLRPGDRTPAVLDAL